MIPLFFRGRALTGALAGALACLATLPVTACVSTSLVEVAPTNAVTDPAVVASAAGAKQLYVQSLSFWANWLGGQPNGAASGQNFILHTGFFTDELMWAGTNTFTSPFTPGTDEHNDGSISNIGPAPTPGSLQFDLPSIIELSQFRNNAHVARQALELYAGGPASLRARLQAAEGYAIIYQAELFCSGVPLSTTSLTGEIHLTRGLSTEEMLAAAVVLFDSAITLAGDSTRFKYLASVGKGRALLQMGKFADAATAVADVPTTFVYNVELSSTTTISINVIGNRPQNMQVKDNEGTNGLVWSTDPRAAIVTTPTITGAMPIPGKYSVIGGVINAVAANPNAPVRAADGLEARLIEAEAALSAGNTSWLTTLNTLRGTCIGAAACAPVPGLSAANLPATLTDPGNADARLNLLMQERAMWLYLTGHRQGDLRRLAHVYHRDPLTLWPVGLYVNPGFPPQVQPAGTNGIVSYVNLFVFFPRADQEQVRNPLYAGCNDLTP